MSYGLSRYLRGMEACMCACVIKDAISCPCPITANCSPAVAAFTGDGRWMAHCNQSQCDPSPTLCRLQFYLTLCTLGAGGCFLCWQSPISPLPMSVNGIVAELLTRMYHTHLIPAACRLLNVALPTPKQPYKPFLTSRWSVLKSNVQPSFWSCTN